MRSRKKPVPAKGWALPAELTIQHATALRDQLQDAVTAGAVVFDGSGVEAIDTSGAQLLLAVQRAVGAGFVLDRASPSLDAILHLYRLHDRLAPSIPGARP